SFIGGSRRNPPTPLFDWLRLPQERSAVSRLHTRSAGCRTSGNLPSTTIDIVAFHDLPYAVPIAGRRNTEPRTDLLAHEHVVAIILVRHFLQLPHLGNHESHRRQQQAAGDLHARLDAELLGDGLDPLLS